MNPRHALLVVTSLLSAHSAAGLITPIVSGLNVYLPIIGAASTAGLGTVLAALGALKLGAVAVLLATSQQQVADEVEAGGYSAPALEEVDTYGAPAAEVVESYGAPAHYRQRRSAELLEAGTLLRLLERLDQAGCAKQLVCQLHAAAEEDRTPEQEAVIAMFSKLPGSGPAKMPLAEFDVAAKIGRVSGSVATCAEAYSACPYTARQISSLYGSL